MAEDSAGPRATGGQRCRGGVQSSEEEASGVRGRESEVPPNVSRDAVKKERTGRRSQKLKAILDDGWNREFEV